MVHLDQLRSGPVIHLPAQSTPYKTGGGEWRDVTKERKINVIDGHPGSHREKCVAVQVSSTDPAELPTLIVGGNVMYTQDAVEMAYRIIEQRNSDLKDEKQRYREEQDRWRQYVHDVLTSKREYQKKNWRTSKAPRNVN